MVQDRSYLEGRGYYVNIGEHKSEWTSMTWSPQGSNFCATAVQYEPNNDKEQNLLTTAMQTRHSSTWPYRLMTTAPLTP